MQNFHIANELGKGIRQAFSGKILGTIRTRQHGTHIYSPLKEVSRGRTFSAVWLGVIVLIASIVFVFLPGTRDPRAELTHRAPYSIADRFLPFPIYGVTLALFVGIVVLWQMRREPRPLPDGLVLQRVQAWVAIALSLIAAAIIYIHVALHGPR